MAGPPARRADQDRNLPAEGEQPTARRPSGVLVTLATEIAGQRKVTTSHPGGSGPNAKAPAHIAAAAPVTLPQVGVVAQKIIGPEALTRAEVAAVLGVHPSTIARWATAGLLPCFRTPTGERRYHRCEVQAFLNQAQPDALALARPGCRRQE